MAKQDRLHRFFLDRERNRFVLGAAALLSGFGVGSVDDEHAALEECGILFPETRDVPGWTLFCEDDFESHKVKLRVHAMRQRDMATCKISNYVTIRSIVKGLEEMKRRLWLQTASWESEDDMTCQLRPSRRIRLED